MLLFSNDNRLPEKSRFVHHGFSRHFLMYKLQGNHRFAMGFSPEFNTSSHSYHPAIKFSPRLADAGGAIFWRADKMAHYGALNELARGCVELSKIESQWDEMMRMAGSLKLGTIHA